MQTTAWLILLFPLAGCVLIGVGFRTWPARVAGAVGTLAIAAAFVAAVLTTMSLQDRGEEQRQVVYSAWDYAVTVGVDAKLSILVDPLSMFMALVVTGVSTLIHLYSVPYLGGDRGYARFFAYLNFFVFSMLVLVLAGNLLVLIVGWALVGAFAKSAQIPLHPWLPDAMEGPTPVSALIHAATMVTAGVYLIARMHPLFERAPAAADVGAVIGCVTLLVAAGSVISAMGGEQNLDRMGGFRRAMPFTCACFVVGGLALSGVQPFSGFFSKDEIL